MKAGSRLVDANTVSQMSGLSPFTIRRYARIGRIPARKIGQRTWFVLAEVEQWLAGLPRAS